MPSKHLLALATSGTKQPLEMKLFLGMILIMGVHRLPQLEDYWSANPLLGVKGITLGMPLRRFRVLTTLHLADNSLAIPRGQPGFDKLYKIRPLLNIIVTNTQAAYSLHREISVDEAMIGFKGRSSMKQFMPMKPTKRGYKAWCLCDPHNGLTYNVDSYIQCRFIHWERQRYPRQHRPRSKCCAHHCQLCT